MTIPASADAAIRARRHLAAFMGDCNVVTCEVCGPLRCTGDDSDACRRTIGQCAACGYVMHDIPRSSDTAHDDLCCGYRTEAECRDEAARTGDDYICVTHQRDVADEDALLDGWYSITAKDGSTAVICGECTGNDWTAVTRVDGPRDTGDERSEPCASCGDRLWLRCFTHGEACPALAADEDICDPDDD